VTVKELIEALQKMPQDMEVVVFANDSEYTEASELWVEEEVDVPTGKFNEYKYYETVVRIA
jgi:hypothetical protein